MRLDDVLGRDATVEELVRLQIGVGEGRPGLRIVVRFGEEARGPENDAGEPLVAPEKPAQVLGRSLGDAVDVLRNGSDVFVDPGGGLSRPMKWPSSFLAPVLANSRTSWIASACPATSEEIITMKREPMPAKWICSSVSCA